MKSRTQTPRNFTFPEYIPPTELVNQTVKSQIWCRASSSLGTNDIAIQTINGDVLVLCEFKIDSNGQHLFTKLQFEDLTEI